MVLDGEAVSLQEKYTYDKFLALGAEGICAISDETAQLYEKWSDETDWFHGSVTHFIDVLTYDRYMIHVENEDGGYDTEDLETVRDILALPDEMWLSGMGGSDDVLYRYFDVRTYTEAPYNEYEYSYLAAATLVWLESNPAVESVKMSAYSTGGVWEPPVTGDADGNGTIDLSDAVKVLTIYAENASGLNRAIYGSTLDSAADVNSDGNIDLDDAVAILTYYAHNAAGLDPSWDAILAQ